MQISVFYQETVRFGWDAAAHVELFSLDERMVWKAESSWCDNKLLNMQYLFFLLKKKKKINSFAFETLTRSYWI